MSTKEKTKRKLARNYKSNDVIYEELHKQNKKLIPLTTKQMYKIMLKSLPRNVTIQYQAASELWNTIFHPIGIEVLTANYGQGFEQILQIESYAYTHSGKECYTGSTLLRGPFTLVQKETDPALLCIRCAQALYIKGLRL